MSIKVMVKVYPCPHCRTQNLATGARLRQAARVPLTCWKCGEKIQKPLKPRRNVGERKEGSREKRRK